MTTSIEKLAIELHDHIWLNVGTTDDWPIHLGGDDEEITELIRLMNTLQDEIKLAGKQTFEYDNFQTPI